MRIKQQEEYQGSGWWSWAVWIEGTSAELLAIEKVAYTLHPTFVRPVRTVTDRKSKFRLDEAGWGGFTIYASVYMKSGKPRKLEHELELYYPSDEATDSIVIRIKDSAKSDHTAQLRALQQAIEEYAPDVPITSQGPREDASPNASLKVAIARPVLFSAAKGIQGWLSVNPQATLSFQKGGQKVENITTGGVLGALNSLQSESDAGAPSKRPSAKSSSKARSKTASPRKARKKARR